MDFFLSCYLYLLPLPYQYIVSGQMGAPIKLQLHPAPQSSDLMLGVIDANCAIADDGTLTGRWQSSIGTNGIFRARRYQDLAASGGEELRRSNVFIS